MLTIGLSFHELERVTKILDAHGVQYEVGGGHEVQIEEEPKQAKKPKGRGNTSFYDIEIPEAEFSKLPAAAVTQLAELGVFPEMEAPDFGPENTEPRPKPVPSKSAKIHNWIMLAITVIVLILIVKKRVSRW